MEDLPRNFVGSELLADEIVSEQLTRYDVTSCSQIISNHYSLPFYLNIQSWLIVTRAQFFLSYVYLFLCQEYIVFQLRVPEKSDPIICCCFFIKVEYSSFIETEYNPIICCNHWTWRSW
jgi:hypothetical protein